MSNPSPDSPGNVDDSSVDCLRKAVDIEREYLTAYERPSEAITYEVLRTLDDIFCRDLMEPSRVVGRDERLSTAISTWGVNHALRRVLPSHPVSEPFQDFPSQEAMQSRADDFIFHCGALAVGERLLGWLEEGLLVGEVRPYPNDKLSRILVLQNRAKSCHDEEIGRAGLHWASDVVWRDGLDAESALEDRYREIAHTLEHHVRLAYGWRIEYSTTREIDEHFAEWGRHYLRRIFSQDLIGLDDVIGGRPFSRYLDVLSALSARSQKHLAFAAILRARHPSVHIRNLLTTYCPREDFVGALAEYLPGDRKEVESILASLTLSPENLEAHTRGGDVTWPPIVQASADWLLMPTFGVDINPFLFLLTDLRFRYETDWFSIANNREGRWVKELKALFLLPRWRTHDRNVQLRDAGRAVTDIDFAAYDAVSNELCLFQLKWQHPIGLDNRTRRSAGKNFVQECNKWIGATLEWAEKHGAQQLMQRIGLECLQPPRIRLFVLGRYHAHFSGYEQHDDRAVWSAWANFRKVCMAAPDDLAAGQLESQLRLHHETAQAEKRGESTMYPIGNVAIVLNPTSRPAE